MMGLDSVWKAAIKWIRMRSSFQMCSHQRPMNEDLMRIHFIAAFQTESNPIINPNVKEGIRAVQTFRFRDIQYRDITLA